MSETSRLVFALDIGTRSVVGLLLKEKDGRYELIDSETLEHDDRAMLDGQIHDVLSVAKTIRAVKEKLERKNGPLHRVCVAAAGRSLKTRRAKIEIDIAGKPLLREEDILHLELSAVQQAQFDLAEEQSDQANVRYYCVGYSVLNYFLDGERIGSLIEQTGKKAAVHVIATFLPSIVIDSLTAALTRANLELEALTLEPIAAINVLIPPTMRRLNIALVDIGAGTSDIALTDENTVIAYGMVPIAGDEITEAICDHFLLDFPDAEIAKRKLCHDDVVTITDILGNESTLSRDEIIAAIADKISELARSISDEILTLNGKPPQAVMLIGGGSLTPHLREEIAAQLRLPENRVAVRDANAIKQLIRGEDDHFGPELVTPIGIAISAKKHAIRSIRITVNEQPVMLFEVKQLTVGDALLAAGLHLTKLYGKPGLALMVTVNGRLITIPGEHGSPPKIWKNGDIASLDDPVFDNDDIVVEAGKDGNNAEATIEQLIGGIETTTVTMNGKKVELYATISKNGERVNPNTAVAERDVITVQQPTVRDLLRAENVSIDSFERQYIYLNDERVELPGKSYTVFVNGKKAHPDTSLQTGDVVQFEKHDGTCTVRALLKQQAVETTMSITVFFNDEPITLEKQLVDIKRNDEPLTEDSPIYPNDRLTIRVKKREPFILQDVFAFVDINVNGFTGKKIVLQKNGEDANFTDVIETGDRIELHLE